MLHRLLRQAAWVVLLAALTPGLALAARTMDISLGPGGVQGNGHSSSPRLTWTGDFVVYASRATNLVENVTNGKQQIFLWTRFLNETDLVSVNDDGVQANDDCLAPSVTPDGRFIVFMSSATNLVAGTVSGTSYIFVRDRVLGKTECVSVASDGTLANGSSWDPVIDDSGRYVVFASNATDLAAGLNANTSQVFVHDRQTGTTELLSVATDGTPGNNPSDMPAISANGSIVAFASTATDLVAGDTDNAGDVFVRDLTTGTTELVSVASDGGQPNGSSDWPSVSADGRYVAFESGATNLVPGGTNPQAGSGGGGGIFLRDRQAGTTELVDLLPDGIQPTYAARAPFVSADGRFVTFALDTAPQYLTSLRAATGPPGPDDCYVRDRLLQKTEQVDVKSDGTPGAAGVEGSCPITKDGRYVAFASYAANLVPNDTNGCEDVFLRDRGAPDFVDVPSDFWAYAEIMACANADIVQGYTGGNYGPSLTVTRDQMAVFVARAVTGQLSVPTGPATPSFSDVPTDFWAYREIEYCKAHDIVAGFPDGLYHPEGTVTRDQMAVYISRAIPTPSGMSALANYAPPTTPSFSDVPTDFWAYKWIEYARQAGLVQGYPDGYHPADAVTRDQMAVYIARGFSLPE